MMKVKIADLRIGSHYSYDNDYIKLDGSLLATYLQNDTDLDLYSIPLTDEWLLKFRFKTRTTENISIQYFIGANPVTRDWMFDILWLKGDEYPFYRNGYFKIKYVHQLQNLYFALTGEELTIKAT